MDKSGGGGEELSMVSIVSHHTCFHVLLWDMGNGISVVRGSYRERSTQCYLLQCNDGRSCSDRLHDRYALSVHEAFPIMRRFDSDDSNVGNVEHIFGFPSIYHLLQHDNKRILQVACGEEMAQDNEIEV